MRSWLGAAGLTALFVTSIAAIILHVLVELGR